MNLSLQTLVPILQLAIAPVILISGVGLLLLTLTNRFGRVIDRSRLLARERAAAGELTGNRQAQLEILERRASILRLSITLGAITVLSAAVLILALFIAALAQLPLTGFIVVVFILGQVALVGSMLAFLRELNLSLHALRLEVRGTA